MTEPAPPVRLIDHLLLASAFLKGKGVPSPRLEAEVLLASVLGRERIYLYTQFDRPLSEEERAAYRDLLRRRASGEPTAYLTRTREFFGRSFTVLPGVLVPRPETERLVEEALELVDERAARTLTVGDVGCGSGCIIVTLLAERLGLFGLAIDISPACAGLTRDNAVAHGVADRLAVLVGDLAGSLAPGCLDVAVSNPPYIPSARLAALPREVRFEPVAALDGGPDGLGVIRRLATDLARVLASGGAGVMEIDEEQGDGVPAILAAAGLSGSRVLSDLSGKDRIVAFRKE